MSPNEPPLSAAPWGVLPVLCTLLSGCALVPLAERALEREYRGAELRETTVQLGDDRVHFWDGGTQERPVLLIHGFGTPAVWQWFPQVEAFAQEHHIILPDLLWFGESDSTAPDYRLIHQTRAMVALLDHLELERVDVVGISYGGMVAYDLASRFPERVRRLVVVDSPGTAYERADYEALCARFDTDDFRDVLVPENARRMRQLLNSGMDRELYLPNFVVRQVRRDLFLESPEARRGMLTALLNEVDDLDARPEARAADTLLVFGRHDPIFPIGLGERLHRSLGPRSRLEIIEDARHTPNLEWPEHFNALVLQYLRMPCSCEVH